MDMQQFSVLFEREPDTWGLRGDPALWKAMQAHFSTTPLPDSPAELLEKIADAFTLLTGQPLYTPEQFYLEEFAGGGMSGGYICPEWWRDEALPFFKHALAQTQQDDPARSNRRTDK